MRPEQKSLSLSVLMCGENKKQIYFKTKQNKTIRLQDETKWNKKAKQTETERKKKKQKWKNPKIKQICLKKKTKSQSNSSNELEFINYLRMAVSVWRCFVSFSIQMLSIYICLEYLEQNAVLSLQSHVVGVGNCAKCILRLIIIVAFGLAPTRMTVSNWHWHDCDIVLRNGMRDYIILRLERLHDARGKWKKCKTSRWIKRESERFKRIQKWCAV